MKIVGERLRLLRESIHLSQAKIADEIGVSQASVNRYEKDLAAPPQETLLWYADFFNVSLDYIFGRTDNPHGKKFSNMPSALQKKVRSQDEWEEFVEMCFDPNSPMSVRLKETLLSMMQDNGEG